MKSKTQWSSYPISLVFITLLALGNLVTQQATAAEVKLVKDVPKIEQQLVESIATEGTKDRFLIPEIRPAGTGSIKGTICIAGKGSLPLSKDTAERLGEGVILEWIRPVQRGAEVNAHKGKSGMLLRNQQLDYSPTYSVGAIWERIPNLIDKDLIDPLNGVAFVPGVRLGGLYDGDGNLMFDYVKAGEQIVHFPAGTAGSIIRFVGELTVGKYVFIGNNDVLYPLTFLLTSDGFLYLRGKGQVKLPTGKMVDLGKIAKSSAATEPEPQFPADAQEGKGFQPSVDLVKDKFVEVPELLDVTSPAKVHFKKGTDKGIVIAEVTGTISIYRKNERFVYCLASVEEITVEAGLQVPLIFFTAELEAEGDIRKWIDQQQIPGSTFIPTMKVGEGTQTVDLSKSTEPEKWLLVAGASGAKMKKKGKGLLLLDGEAHILRRK